MSRVAGIGVDLVELARVERLVARKGERALARLFTAREIEYAHRHLQPARHLAARLAAKEAAFKALAGTEAARGIGWREVEVVRDEHGRPSLAFHGRAAERAQELGVTASWLSISHDGHVAIAMVVLEHVGT